MSLDNHHVIIVCSDGCYPRRIVKSYYYMISNAAVEMSIYDAKGDLAGKQQYKIADVKKKWEAIWLSTFSSSFLDKKGKEVSKNRGANSNVTASLFRWTWKWTCLILPCRTWMPKWNLRIPISCTPLHSLLAKVCRMALFIWKLKRMAWPMVMDF